MRTRRYLLVTGALMMAALLAGYLIAKGTESSGGGSDATVAHKGKATEFAADPDAKPYAGPAPVTIKFNVAPKGATGAVTYRWDFDDGTTSNEQNPTHIYRKPSFYRVTLDARDARGHSDHWNLVVRAWEPKEWEASLRGDPGVAQRSAREARRFARRKAAESVPKRKLSEAARRLRRAERQAKAQRGSP